MSFNCTRSSDNFLITVAEGRGVASGTGRTWGSVVVVVAGNAVVLTTTSSDVDSVDVVDAFTEHPARTNDTASAPS